MKNLLKHLKVTVFGILVAFLLLFTCISTTDFYKPQDVIEDATSNTFCYLEDDMKWS